MTEMEDFLKALKKDPDLPGKLQKKEELKEFKEKYSVGRATPLKCPACAAVLQYPGSLYEDPSNRSRFVCKKCKLVWFISTDSITNEELIANLRLVIKGDEKATLDWNKKIGNTINGDHS